tara:strand:- start:1 stop:252 length:252 start_codon:yes stop_codon:yes gene_type:complete
MARYTIKTLENCSFNANTDSEFVQGLRDNHAMPMEDDADMLRLMAATYCEYKGKSFRFSNVQDFVADCVKHGVMEVDYAERAR